MLTVLISILLLRSSALVHWTLTFLNEHLCACITSAIKLDGTADKLPTFFKCYGSTIKVKYPPSSSHSLLSLTTFLRTSPGN